MADHDLDLVPVFSSMNHDAEMEALGLKALLEAAGIESTVVGTSTLPVVEFQVQVARAQAEEAERIIAEARAAGPAAAEEAEAETEKEGGVSGGV